MMLMAFQFAPEDQAVPPQIAPADLNQRYSFTRILEKNRSRTCRPIRLLLSAIFFAMSRAAAGERALRSTRSARSSKPHMTGIDSASQLSRKRLSLETQVHP